MTVQAEYLQISKLPEGIKELIPEIIDVPTKKLRSIVKELI